MSKSDVQREDDSPPTIRMHVGLRPTLQARTFLGVSALPKSRKARALLALIALSEGHSVSRARAATMLWSSLQRTEGLARLRNLLHHLQQDFLTAGVEPLRINDSTISLRAEVVSLDVETASPAPNSQAIGGAGLLADLDGIDPAFDRWLTHTRNKVQSAPAKADTTANELPENTSRDRTALGPCLVVTVFDHLGSGVDDDLARTVTEEVGSALSKLRWITTITRTTEGNPFTVDKTDIPTRADYLLVGTIQRSGGIYRLSLKMLDLRSSGEIVWAGAFQSASENIFEMQSSIATRVTATLDEELLYVEANRRKQANGSLRTDTYTVVLLAILDIYRLEKVSFLGAGHALEEAIVADPESALAHSWLAYWHMFFIGQGWATNPMQSMAQAGRAASHAMMLDPRDARAVTIAGHVKAFLNYQLDEAATLHELAIQLNPALSLAWHLNGVTHAYAGRLDDAYACVCRCRELAPNNPHGFYAEGALGIIHLLRGEHADAVAIGRRVTERHPHFTSAYKSYLSALGHLGRKSEAAAVIQRLASLEPSFSLRRFRASAHYRRPQDLEHFLTGLRLAGLP